MVLPLPQASVEQLMRRDLEFKRPFARKQGRGLRDYLIWLSILEARKKYAGRIVFVTANHTDFAVNGKLAPEYLEDLRAIGEPDESVAWVASPEDFLEQFVKPSEKETKAVQGKSIAEAFGDDLETAVDMWLESQLHETENADDWLQYFAGNLDDLDLGLWGKADLVFGVRLGTVQRVMRLDTGERLVDVEARWSAIVQNDNRDRPDDPFDYYEGTYEGTVRFLLDKGKKVASSIRILELSSVSLDEISEEAQWALELRSDRLEAEAGLA
jgi:hypothetical protein